MASVLVMDSAETAPVALMAARARHQVTEVTGSGEVLQTLLRDRPDVLVIPEYAEPVEGVELLPVLRRMTNAIIVVVGSGEESHEAQALLQGADMYLVAPVNPNSFPPRLQALLRRPSRRFQERESRESNNNDKRAQNSLQVSLSPLEERILDLLLARRGMSIPAEELVVDVWGREDRMASLRFYIHRLRSKVERSSVWTITSQRGIGYRLDVQTDGASAG